MPSYCYRSRQTVADTRPSAKTTTKVPVPFVVVCGWSLLVERIELRLQRIELIQTHKALFARR